MNNRIHNLLRDWPAWLAISFIALLPARRLSEIPLALFAIAMPFLWHSAKHHQRTRSVLLAIGPLFLCFWLPMVLSSFDSYDPAKSWSQSLTSIRYFMAAVAIGVLLHPRPLYRKVFKWSAFILLFWAVDGFIQLIFGYDVFGIPMHEDRLNALFFKKVQFYGPIMAMLSPLLLEYARLNWKGWAWAVSFAAILGAVLIAGMRAGWVVMAVVIGVYGLLMLRSENRALRRKSLAVPALFLLVITVSYLASPIFQQRVETTLAITEGTTEALNEASSLRVPIFRHALAMYQDHPVNGVGVRAFPMAYLEYAEPDDPHVAMLGGEKGARHAHNVVLEAMADMGTIGLLGWFAMMALGWRLWRSMAPEPRQDAFPYVFALMLVYFPLNTHFAIWGTFLSSLIWILVGMWASSLTFTQSNQPLTNKTDA